MTVPPLELREYKPRYFPAAQIPQPIGEQLWQQYASQVEVEAPSFKTSNQWRLTAQGWVGYIPLAADFAVMLHPKVPLANLFRMWEYAYRLDFHFLPSLYDSQSLAEFYERLANVLARRVLDRSRRGLYRAYVSDNDRLAFVRGRLDVSQLAQADWRVQLPCHFHEHTADVEDNQILAWTLSVIARSSLCSERTQPTIRRVYHDLRGAVTPRSFRPQECSGRSYHRLNDDYRLLHALCRFFLEHSGPQHELGDRAMLPFLVNMSQLYESFVAEWLRANLTSQWRLVDQHRMTYGRESELIFKMDLVLFDAQTNHARYVLDTKYKTPDTPANEDIFQVVAYAEALGCHEAVLVYPTKLARPLDQRIGRIRVRSLTFALDGDLEQAGQALLTTLFET